jgi:hypothetical protein
MSGASASLECGDYHFYVTDRGGVKRHFELNPMIRFRWTRQRDAISEATVFVSTESPECCQYMESMECGRHELVIERNGARVWEGPLTRIAYHRDYVEVEAHDVMHYAYRAIMKSKYNNAYPHIVTAVSRANTILSTELARFEALSPPINVVPHMVVFSTTGTAKTARNTKKYQRTVWEEIDEMAARGGIDYTVVGRKILLFDVDDIIGKTKPMTEADFVDEIVVTQYGMELATFSAVTDGEGHYGSTQVTASLANYYGIWEILESQYDQQDSAKKAPTPTAAEMRSQAKRNASHRCPTPLVVRVPDGAQLAETTGVLLTDLVPGAHIPLNATQTCRQVSQEQKLDKLEVEGEVGNETFRVTLSPKPGIADWEDAETS